MGFIFIPFMSNLVNRTETFIIIPAYNEQQVIKKVIADMLPYRYSVVIIDDGSSPPLKELLGGMPVYILTHKINLGQGAALQTGIEFALSKDAAYIVTFDADGQHQPSDIEKMLLPLQNQEADITLGSRFIIESGNIPGNRKRLLKLARFINYLFTGLLLTDAHNGLRAMTNTAASSIKIRQNGMAHATEIINEIKRNKLTLKEIPVTIHYSDYSRKKGQSVWSGFRIFFDLLLSKILK